MINKKRIEIVVIITIIMVAIVVKNVSYKSFLDYENTILSQQNSHILTISKSTSKNLEVYIDEKLKEIEALGDNILLLENRWKDRKRIEEELRLFIKYQKEVIEVSYLEEGMVVSHSKDGKHLERKYLEKGLTYIRENKKAYISEVRSSDRGELQFYIYYPVAKKGELKGVILSEISMEKLYKRVIEPIDIGKKGYLIVKDSKGLILMHPDREVVGHTTKEVREKIYTSLEPQEMEAFMERQLREKEGTYIANSYLWAKDIDKMMYGYSPASIGDDFWLVSVVMSYTEISDSIKNYLYSTLALSFIVITVSAWTLSLFIRMTKNKEAYKMEKSYLEELNKTTEKLRKREAELHHKRKIELIGSLTGGIAHEFNNILTPIKGYSEMILENLDKSSEMYEDVKIINDSAKRSQDIIDQILSNSNRRTKFNYEEMSLNKLINDIKRMIKTLVPSDVRVSIDIDEDEELIRGNETQLHQVVVNLIKNSINAMNGSLDKKLWIRLSKEIRDGVEYSRIVIEDTGCGMTEETIENIFTPFYTKKLSKDSTGLGLYVAREIIKGHNGSIEVRSELGYGSSFRIFIPLIKRVRLEEYKKENIVKKRLTGSERVVILDDEEFIVKMLKKGLESQGYTTKSFTDTRNFLRYFHDLDLSDYHVLITDLTMPGMSGIELSKCLRSRNKHLKIIMVTAYLEDSLDGYLKNGLIDGYLQKPVSYMEINNTIRSLID